MKNLAATLLLTSCSAAAEAPAQPAPTSSAAPTAPAPAPSASASALIAPSASASAATAPEDLRGKNGVPADLRVVYDDVHPLYGGTVVTVTGDGAVEAKRRERAEPEQTRASRMTADELVALHALLVEIKFAQQRTRRRVAVPDESRETLTVTADGKTSTIWEWSNDVDATGRLARVRDLLAPFLPTRASR